MTTCNIFEHPHKSFLLSLAHVLSYFLDPLPAQDFRSGVATDIMALQNYLHSQVNDGTSAVNDIPPDTWPSYESDVTGFLDWLGDDYHQIDAHDVEKRLRMEPPVLEKVPCMRLK